MASPSIISGRTTGGDILSMKRPECLDDDDDYHGGDDGDHDDREADANVSSLLLDPSCGEDTFDTRHRDIETSGQRHSGTTETPRVHHYSITALPTRR